MNVLDLFSGACGGWSLGLERAGFRTVAACEIDGWRRVQFARNFPGVRIYDDVRGVSAERLRADGIGPVDVVAGSPPCQDASTANAKGKGIDGERTGLFWEAVRIVREVRPRWVCLENVPGLRTRGYDRIHAALETEGYAVRPLVVGAWHAGAPHRRNRVWIIANMPGIGCGQGRPGRSYTGDAWQSERALHHADPAAVQRASIARSEPDGIDAGAAADSEKIAGGGGPDIALAESQIVSRHTDETGLEIREGIGSDSRQERAPAIRTILEGWRGWNGGAPDLGRMDAGLPKGMARHLLAAYGDAVVPQITEAIGRAIMQAEMNTYTGA